MNKPQGHRGTDVEALSGLTGRIIGAAIQAHKILGPGLLESIDEAAMCIELEEGGLRYNGRSVSLPAAKGDRSAVSSLEGGHQATRIVTRASVSQWLRGS
jgi:hypothetical protein